MTEKPDNPDLAVPADQTSEQRFAEPLGGTVTIDGTSYQIGPTAFRSHYQVTRPDGMLLGLIEAVETVNGRSFRARPATGAGMTQSLMVKIVDQAAALGVIR